MRRRCTRVLLAAANRAVLHASGPPPFAPPPVYIMPVMPYPPPTYAPSPPQPAPIHSPDTSGSSAVGARMDRTIRFAFYWLLALTLGMSLVQLLYDMIMGEEEEASPNKSKPKARPGKRIFPLDKLMDTPIKPVDLSAEVHRVFFDDVKGCDEAKQELKELAEFLKNPMKFTRLGGQLPKGVLLMGPPGTGKTMMAKAVANEAGVPFFYMSGSDFEEALVGVGAARVRELFAAAKQHSPCLVFIDEIDAVGFSRKGKYMTNPHAHQALNQLLAEMDGFKSSDNVIVIGATNHAEALDPALIRPGRFDKQVAVHPPDVLGRADLIIHRLRKVITDSSVDPKILARGTPGFVGADLANLINVAAVMAAGAGAPAVTMAHLEEAKERVLMGNALHGRKIDELERKITAYHEGGHALVALLVEGSDPLYKATIIPRGRALGMTTTLPESETSRTRQQMLARLCVCMGGRVAEELIFGEKQVTTGAVNDFEMATNLAENMVRRFGMSKLGNQDFQSQLEHNTLSEQTKHLLEAEVKALLDNSYSTAQRLLKEKEKELHLIAKALIDYETLDADQMRALMRGEKLDPPFSRDAPAAC
eukprot:TRINITY_DN3536_c0_g1_i1.p1 TRINITY_DN3536_c0_g1~~TRINITY_DN3536_c0_g1_i1.p1  ORF type:complete len:591 (+),score=106.87 TRINITY_DN3536_c0_g1_i1:64-1836(+)